jgi:hypothetical protein
MEVENTDRFGGWIQTYSGRPFWPLDPRPEDVFIRDIAHALSIISRYAGHCIRPYSVAQHSVLVAHTVDREQGKEIQFEGLMHDGSEAYISDIPSPAKIHFPDYRRAEAKIEEAIAQKFGLEWPWPPGVKRADLILFKTEARDLLVHSPKLDDFVANDIPILDTIITPWSPDKAEFMFNLHFDYIREGRDISELHKYVFN